MKTIRILTLLFVLITFHCCKPDAKVAEVEKGVVPIPKKTSRPDNINISVLIDLSDRINPKKYPSPAMEFYQRDVGYIQSVTQSFETHLLGKRVLRIDDKIQVFIDPEPSDETLNQKIGTLKTHFTQQNVVKDSILNISQKYGTTLKLIYESAIEDNNYVGSNLWDFFKNNVNDYCIDAGYRNILVILTDGYLFHKDVKIKQGGRTSFIIPQTIRENRLYNADWQELMETKDFGFITANTDLADLEVLVLGINPAKGNPYEEDIIRAYWKKWMNEMNVGRYAIKQADLPTHLNKVISDFILKN